MSVYFYTCWSDSIEPSAHFRKLHGTRCFVLLRQKGYAMCYVSCALVNCTRVGENICRIYILSEVLKFSDAHL